MALLATAFLVRCQKMDHLHHVNKRTPARVNLVVTRRETALFQPIITQFGRDGQAYSLNQFLHGRLQDPGERQLQLNARHQAANQQIASGIWGFSLTTVRWV